jgi:hypothetical protein
MSIGASLAVIALGAILSFATHLRTHGFSVIAMGGVLMVVGLAGLAMQIAALRRQRMLTVAQAEQPARSVVVRPPVR